MSAFTIPVVVLALIASGANARITPDDAPGIAAGMMPHLGGVYEPSAYGGVNPVTHVHESSIMPSVLDGVAVYNFTTVLEIADGLPVPAGPQDCNPAAPSIAEDGFPFLAARTYFFDGSSKPVLNKTVSEVTGFKSFSVDYNPCGHPPVGVFTVPHFDIHYFYMSNEDRLNMQCGGDVLCFNTPGSMYPKFFDVPKDMANIPEGFEMDPMNVGVAEMGLHWWKQPVTTPWEEVTLIMGTYGGSANFWELMFPAFGALSGGAGRDIKYQSQTMDYLPIGYDVAFDGKKISISIYTESRMF